MNAQSTDQRSQARSIEKIAFPKAAAGSVHGEQANVTGFVLGCVRKMQNSGRLAFERELRKGQNRLIWQMGVAEQMNISSQRLVPTEPKTKKKRRAPGTGLELRAAPREARLAVRAAEEASHRRRREERLVGLL